MLLAGTAHCRHRHGGVERSQGALSADGEREQVGVGHMPVAVHAINTFTSSSARGAAAMSNAFGVLQATHMLDLASPYQPIPNRNASITPVPHTMVPNRLRRHA